jgi:hypothetical protein
MKTHLEHKFMSVGQKMTYDIRGHCTTDFKPSIIYYLNNYLFKFAKIITIKISYFCLTEEHIYSVNNENVNIILKLMTFPEYF